MKTLKKILVILALPLIYFLIASSFKPTENLTNTSEETKPIEFKSGMALTPSFEVPKDFTHFLLNPGLWDSPRGWDFNYFWDYYRDTLNFNGIQVYDYGNSRTGYFDQIHSQSQVDTLNGFINGTISRGLKPMFTRRNLELVASYGRRMSFEGEGGNDYYSFQNRLVAPSTDSGRSVLFACATCPPPENPQANRLCYGIDENYQFASTYLYPWDPPIDWHLKPVMRIRESDFSPNDTRPVVAIYTKNFRGDYIDTVVIRVNNFRDGNNNYFGQYKSAFTFLTSQGGNDSLQISGRRDTITGLLYGYELPNVAESLIDFEIHWFGEVDVWFDKLIVDNDLANRLFNPSTLLNYDPYIKQELDNYWDRMFMYTIDECVTTALPCVKYIQDYIRNYNQQYGRNCIMSYATSNNLNAYFTKHDENDYKLYLDYTHPQVFQVDAHAIQFHDQGEPGCIPVGQFDSSLLHSYIPQDWKVSNSVYNEYIQEVLGNKSDLMWISDGSLVYQINRTRTQIAQSSPSTRLTIQPAIQGWLIGNTNTGLFRYGVREPLNEEISAEAWIALAWGADNLCWFWLASQGPGTGPPPEPEQRTKILNEDTPIAGDTQFCFGVFTQPGVPRRQNCYGQNKFDYLREMNAKILNLKPTLDAIEWKSAYTTPADGMGHEYIYDIASIIPGRTGMNPCIENWPPNSPYLDCSYETFWEMGFYQPVGNAKYFVMVNRRCVPAKYDGSDRGEARILWIKFDANDLPGSDNWKITDVSKPGSSVTFSKNFSGYVNLNNSVDSIGLFMPGEGKLFKLEPVFPSGGELVADEVIEGNFVLADTIISNGHNITITGTNSSLSFSDSACIIMNGGTFTVDDDTEMTGPNDKVTFKAAVTGHKWGGLKFNGTNVKIFNSKFEDIASPEVNYAVKTANCPLVDIRYNIFTSSTDTSGGVQAVYTESEMPFSGLYITYNTVTMNNSRGNGICVQGFSGLTLPVYIMNNTMTSNGYAAGVMLSTITGGVIKNNTITGFSTGVNTLFSTADLFGNTITNTTGESKGIFTSSESSIGMMPSGTTWLGGYNIITNTTGSSINLQTDNSVFFTDGGRNKFDVTTSASPTAYHMYGSFWDGSYSYRQRNNCFKLDGTAITSPTMPYNFVVIGMNQVSLSFLSYDCSTTPPAEEDIVDIGNGLYDTIPSSGGMGSIEHQRGSAAGMTSESPSELYNAIRTAMRHRNYTNAKSKCYELINTYSDSTESIASLQTLFMSVIATDTGEVSSLKSFYEELILNHGSNTALVKISHYLIQKCKVQLGQYTSALSGFEQIINANPTSYEGLLARWDYMATSLLAPGGGAISNEQLTMSNKSDESEEFDESDKFDDSDDDKSPFTKEQRKVINNSVKEVYNISRTNDAERVKILEERANDGDIGSKKELEKRSTLKELIKTQKPKDAIEHLKIVSSDIQKVFGSTLPVSDKKENENIPLVFRLSQNYPNPFNPVTKISYDIPRDAKVNITVYDILGREVTHLVNNEMKTAGFYIAQFNAMNYASGVYFYRIEAEEPNGTKFVDSKKMVLLK